MAIYGKDSISGILGTTSSSFYFWPANSSDSQAEPYLKRNGAETAFCSGGAELYGGYKDCGLRINDGYHDEAISISSEDGEIRVYDSGQPSGQPVYTQITPAFIRLTDYSGDSGWGRAIIEIDSNSPFGDKAAQININRTITLTTNKVYYLQDLLDWAAGGGMMTHITIKYRGSSRSNFALWWSDRSSENSYATAFVFGSYHRNGFDGNVGYINPKLCGVTGSADETILTKAQIDLETTDTQVDIHLWVFSTECDSD